MSRVLRRLLIALAMCAAVVFGPSIQGSVGGTWQPLANTPPVKVTNCLLMTDGGVMCHRYATNEWYKLTPSSSGSYVNGTWTQLASMPSSYTPLYFASAVLPDGRVIVEGGEYTCKPTCSLTWQTNGAIYDPAANSWTVVAPPDGWTTVGNAMSLVLPDGTFMMGNCCSDEVAKLNAATLTWTPLVGSDPEPDTYNNEEAWVLLPDGTILNVENWTALITENLADRMRASILDPLTGNWKNAGNTAGVLLPDNAPHADGTGATFTNGAGLLRPDGTVFWIGAVGGSTGTAHTALFNTFTKSWAAGPDIPNRDGANDAPAAVLPNGNVLLTASPAPTPPSTIISPTRFYEYDGIGITQVGKPTFCGVNCAYPAYSGGMLVLPTGQVLYTTQSQNVQLYTSTGSALPAWAPAIATVASTINQGATHVITGTQFNGFGTGAAFGDNLQSASNYPLVRITNRATGHVYFARTHNHSTMGVATGTALVSTSFDVPAAAELGLSDLVVVVNGIASAPTPVTVAPPNRAPVASIAPVAPQVTGAGCVAVLALNGAGSSDPDADSLTYVWTEGAVTLGTGVSPQVSLGLGSHTVMLTVDDGHGHSATATTTVTVSDKTAPAFAALTSPLVIEATSPQGAVFVPAAPATDQCDNSPQVTYAPVLPGNVFPLGNTTVTYVASDHATPANTASASQVVSVVDTTPPVLSGTPANITAPATGAAGAVVSFTAPTATDAVTANVAVACTPASGSTFPIGNTTVTCTAKDAANNTATSTFTVTVSDTTPPVLTGTPANITASATGASGALVSFTKPTATDAVSGSAAVTCTPASGSTFALGTTTVTCTAKDAANNTASSTFTVTVSDTTPPVIAAHAAVPAEAASAAGAVVNYVKPTATDAVDGPVTVTCTPPPNSVFARGATTVTCTAKDAANNTASSTFTVTVADLTPPTLSGTPANKTVEALSASGTVVHFNKPTATDAVDGSVTVTCTPASDTTFPIGVTTVTCTAKDAANNSASSSFTVTVSDTTGPVIAAHPPVPASAASAAGAIVTYTAPTAADAVDGTVAVSCVPATGTVFALGATIVTCTAKDAANNSATSTFTVTVSDTTAPTLTNTPSNIVKAAVGANGAPVSFTAPTATDAVDGPVAVTCTPASGSTFRIGVTTVTCTAKDAANNTGSSAFTVTVSDTTGPVIAAHAPVPASATSAAGAIVTYTTPAATDAVDGSVSVTCLPASGTMFALGATTVNCSAKDAANNTSSSSFTVTVSDTTGPVIAAHPPVTASATSAAGGIVTYTAPTATDAVDGSVSVTCLPASGSVFALGATTVTCTAKDAANNSASSMFTVTVSDTTAPVIAAHPPVTASATSAAGAVVTYTAPTATDTVDATIVVTCLPASGSVFALGATAVTCTAKDAANNSASSTFTVTVSDTTAPVIAAHPPVTASATSAAGAVVTYTAPTATDAVDPTVTVTCLPASGSTFALGATTVTCTAKDAASNSATATFTVTVSDAAAPVISGTPANQTVAATSAAGATVTYSLPTANDAVDGAVAVNCVPPSGSVFALGATTVTCTATDTAHNTSSTSFTVTVGDTSAPVISGTPANQTVAATSAAGATVTYSLPTANDAVDGAVAVHCVPASGSVFALGATTVMCTATDTAHNTSSTSFTVTVGDTTAPVITGTPSNLTVNAASAAGAVVGYAAPTATDAVDGPVPVHCVPAPGATFALGTETVTCTATDAAHNSSSTSFTVTVGDAAAPVIAGTPSNMTVNATSAAGAVAVFTLPTALDAIDGIVPVTCVPASGSTFALGVTTVTCSAADAAHNSASTTFTVTVGDALAPIISGTPSNQTASATSAAGAVFIYTLPAATDAIDGAVPVTCVPASGSTFALGVTTVTCSAVDASHNAASTSFTVTVGDTTPPVLTGTPANQTVAAASTAGAAAAYSPPTAIDAVDGPVNVSCVPASGSTFALGATTVTCTAVDAARNQAAATFKITVRDMTAPVISGTPANFAASATSAAGAVVNYTNPSAADVIDGAVVVTCLPSIGSTFAIGTTTVTCTAKDAANNQASTSFVVTVNDTTAPVITGTPANVAVGSTTVSGAAVTYVAPQATDAVDGPVAVACVPAPGATFAIGVTTVTCTATDAARNSSSSVFTVTVSDATSSTPATGATVRVTAPNTAVQWAIGTPRSITWSHTLGLNSFVRIELSRDGGATWEVIAPSVLNATATTGSFVWNVSGPISANALIRVCSKVVPPVADASDVPFAIVAPVLTVTSPNSVGSLRIGNIHTVAFTHNLGVGQGVLLDVSRDGGATWSPIGLVVTTAAVSGSYPWQVNGPVTAQARIRARLAGDATVFDISDYDFSIIDRITVTAPNTAVAWTAGMQKTITWTHNLTAADCVDIDVSRDGGATWTRIASGVPNGAAATGSYVWTVSGAPTNRARIRVSQTANPAANDVSDADFTIAAATVTVTSPNGSGTLKIGAVPNITFTHNLGAGQVMTVEVSRDGAATWSLVGPVTTATATSGVLPWVVTGPATTQARIRVSWAADGAVSDISDVNFTIADDVLGSLGR